MSLGEFLKNSRQSCALSQNKVVAQLHISRQAISAG
ncbi:helix-turn-helix domain-containing protein [Ligilactobacillus salitolerans]|nr:helix-turn-helix domain-containing protein [Ligilactobacillus salitolerans]